MVNLKPHRTICIGDEIDLPQLGGFNAGTIDEMVGNIHEDRLLTQEVLTYLGVTDVLGSNHGIRLYRSIKKRLPSFLNLPEMQYEKYIHDLLLSSSAFHVRSARLQQEIQTNL